MKTFLTDLHQGENKMNKNALKTAGLVAVIALLALEALSFVVTLLDPQGGLLQIDLAKPVCHVIIAAAALAIGVYIYISENRKNKNN